MAENQTNSTNGAAGDPTHYNRRTPEAGAEAANPAEPAKAAGAGATETAAAGEAAVRANQEILRTNVETAQDAMRAGMEASTRAFETMSATVSRTFGLAGGDGQLAEQTAQNVRAVSQATTALARGAQEAAGAWLDLVQQTARTNLEAISQLAACRTAQDLVVLQSKLARENLQRVIEGGQTIASSTMRAVEDANRMMQPNL
jgi:hypothetical protein